MPIDFYSPINDREFLASNPDLSKERPLSGHDVVIYFHDIFLPDDYPDEWILERGWTWNERYMLAAFLMHNWTYELLIANGYLWKERGAAADDLYRGVQPSRGCCG